MKTFWLLPIRREKQFEFPSRVAEQNLHHVREDIIHTFGKDVRKSWTNHKEFVKGLSYRSDLHSPLASSHRNDTATPPIPNSMLYGKCATAAQIHDPLTRVIARRRGFRQAYRPHINRLDIAVFALKHPHSQWNAVCA